MKNVLIILALVLLPLSARAMSPLVDRELEEVSGQSGVSIVPNITMDIHFDVLAWGDPDGITGTASGGYVGVTDVSIIGLSVGMRSGDYTHLFPSRTVNVGDRSFTVFDTGTSLEDLRHPFQYH